MHTSGPVVEMLLATGKMLQPGCNTHRAAGLMRAGMAPEALLILIAVKHGLCLIFDVCVRVLFKYLLGVLRGFPAVAAGFMRLGPAD